MESSNYVAMIIGYLLAIGVTVFLVIAMWKIFVKAGKPGWAAIVPIYNIIVYLKIVGLPWPIIFILLVLGLGGLVLNIMLVFGLARVFGKSVAFGFGLLFLPFIFFPILAFGSSTYQPSLSYYNTPTIS